MFDGITVNGEIITIEHIARAWASINGKRDNFDRGKIDKDFEDVNGYYTGYMIEAEELIKRAITYSKEKTRQ